MKQIHLFSLLALVALSASCILVSGQFVVDFAIEDQTVDVSSVYREVIDLNEEDVYADHRDDIETISDLALIGRVENTGQTVIDVVAYITKDVTSYTTDTEVKQNAIRVWGAFKVNPGATETVGWDASAALFSTLGKEVLIDEVKGDGVFTIYIVASQGTYQFNVTNGSFVVVLDAGA